MISTSSPLAAQAGLWALGRGGTAADAAVAADAVLGVAQPLLTGIGGDAVCLVDDGAEVTAYSGVGVSPAGLTLEAFRAQREADPERQELGALNVTVPGVVDTWAALIERFGHLDLATCLVPARSLARGGFPVGSHTAREWCGSGWRLREGSPFPRSVRPGQRFFNAELAGSLDAIAAGGAQAHYRGVWADAAARAVQRWGGVLTEDDLSVYGGEWVTPVSGPYRDCEVVEGPPTTQGASVLAALARCDSEPPRARQDPAWVAATLRALVEGMRLGGRFIGDPRHAPVPEFWAGTDTVYTAVVAGGMAVSYISSIFHAFGSGISAGGAILQNRGAGFSARSESPNAAAPRKRPFTTITPALLRRDGKTTAVFGAIGGPMQPQVHVHLVAHLVDHGLDPQAALEEPRARWMGQDLVALEPGFHDPAAIERAVRAAGFRVREERLRGWDAGAGQVVRVHADGWLEGGTDPRHDGGCAGGGWS